MALKQAIKTIVLPSGIVPASGGVNAGDLALSVALVPELSGGSGSGGAGTLSDFPDLLNWPNTLTAAGTDFGFVLTLAPPAPKHGTAPAPVVVHLPLTTAGSQFPLNADLWATLFSASTPYTPRTPPWEDPTTYQPGTVPMGAGVVSYPTEPIAGFATGQYGSLPMGSKPTYEDVAAVYGPVADGLVGAAGQAAIAQQAEERRANGVNDFSGATVAEALAAQRYYHTPAIQPQTAPGSQTVVNEFHSNLTLIGQHRALQRALGVVFDFEIRISSSDQLETAVADHGGDGWSLSAQLVSSFSPLTPYAPSGKAQASPVDMVTVANVTRSTFYLNDLPGNGYSVIHEGVVPVGNGDGNGSYGTHQHNVEMAGLNAANFAEKVASYTSVPSGGQDSETVIAVVPDEVLLPPTLDSAGITLTLIQSGNAWQSILERQAFLYEEYDPTAGDKYNTATTPVYASDVVLGLTLDVLDSLDTAHGYLSLNTRNVTYSPVKAGAFTAFDAFDEAGLQSLPTLGLAPPGGTLPQWYVAESLMRFTGWSNAVPLPGVAAPGPSNAGLTSTGGPFADALSIQVTRAPVLPGSRNPSILLPRLRFGRTYTLAVRAVDVANNVVPVGTNVDLNGYVTDPLPYGRQDVIPSPDVFPQNGISGRWPKHTSPNGGYPNYGESLRTLVVRDIDVPAGTVSRRIFAPPSAVPAFVVEHGLLDIDDGTLDSSLDGATAARNWLAAFSDPATATYVPSIVSGAVAPAPPVPSIDVTQPVPYIADPLARKGWLAVADAATADGDAVANGLVDQGGYALPDGFDFQVNGTYTLRVQSDGSLKADPVQPVAFQLVPGAAGAERSVTYDATPSNRLITASLQPADVAVLDLSCGFDTDDLNAAPQGYLFGSIVQTSPSFDAIGAATGQNWALTPATALKLVYTVQRPLIPPTFTAVSAAARKLGDTFVLLEGSMEWSPNSTSHIDVFASWTDATDGGPGASAPNPTVSNVGVGGGGQTFKNVPVFTAPANFTPTAGSANPPVSGFASAGEENAQKTDAFSNGRQEFHDTKNRSVYYTAIGTSRFEEYYPDVSGAGAFQNPDPSTTIFGRSVNVQSSSRPAAPLIDSVVPTYGWTGPTAVNSAEIQSSRSPSALRIWLDRPWFSSGIGELLGVVTWPDAEAALDGHAVKRAGAKDDERGEVLRIDHAASVREHEARKAIGEHDDTVAADKHELASKHTHQHEKAAKGKHPAKRRANTEGVAEASIPDPIGHYVSQWGHDPLFGSAQDLPTPHPTLEAFTGASVYANTIPLQELSGTEVNVAGHPVTYDQVSDRWYADIEMNFGGAYAPMVRLAVVRYQPNSISGAEISRVAVVDVHSLEQGRTVTLYRQNHGGFDIKLTGISYTKVGGGTQLPDNIGADQGGESEKVVPGLAIAQLQQSVGGIADPDLAWKPFGDQITLDGSIASDGTATWTGSVTQALTGPSSYRLHIVQYEQLPKQPDADFNVLGQRILFQDLIDIKF